MYIYVYINIYIYINVCIDSCIHIKKINYVCMYICRYIYVCMCTCIYTSMQRMIRALQYRVSVSDRYSVYTSLHIYRLVHTQAYM